MPRRKRQASTFNLSFLDIMSCGFGAVILIYIVINHATEATSQEVNAQVLSEITRIEELIDNETEQLVMLRNSVQEQNDEIVTTQDMATRLVETIRVLEQELAMSISGTRSAIHRQPAASSSSPVPSPW